MREDYEFVGHHFLSVILNIYLLVPSAAIFTSRMRSGRDINIRDRIRSVRCLARSLAENSGGPKTGTSIRGLDGDGCGCRLASFKCELCASG